MASRITESSLRISIDGYWTALEMSVLMRSLEDIYNLTAVISSRKFVQEELAYRMFPIDRRVLRRLALDVAKNPPLMVSQLQYASPGFIDVLGGGEAIKQLKEFVLGVTDRILERKQRAIANESRQIANEKEALIVARLRSDTEDHALHKKALRSLSIRERELENELLAEKVRALHITNSQAESTAFSTYISKQMEHRELGGGERRNLVNWIGTRSHSVEKLIGSGKISSIDNAPTDGE